MCISTPAFSAQVIKISERDLREYLLAQVLSRELSCDYKSYFCWHRVGPFPQSLSPQFNKQFSVYLPMYIVSKHIFNYNKLYYYAKCFCSVSLENRSFWFHGFKVFIHIDSCSWMRGLILLLRVAQKLDICVQ
jgi:hypothetical protein